MTKTAPRHADAPTLPAPETPAPAPLATPASPLPPDKLKLRDVETAEIAATAAHKLLADGVANRQLPPLRLLDEIWRHYTTQRLDHTDLPARYNRAVAARSVLEAVGALPRATWHIVAEQETTPHPVRGIEGARAALAASPAFAAWRAEADKAEAARQACQAAAAAEAAKRYPAALLDRLRKAGVALTLNDAGDLVAPASAVLSPRDAREVAEHAAAIAALLLAERQAAEPAPIVLAATGARTPREQAKALVATLRRRGITISEGFDYEKKVTRIIVSPADCRLSDDERARLLALKDDVLDAVCGGRFLE